MIRIVIILLLLPVLASAQSLTPAGRVVIRTDIQGVGGLSGIEVFTDSSFLAVSDQGSFVEGEITRINGIIRGVTLTSLRPIVDSKGDSLTSYHTNAEAIAIGPNGDIYIAFEGNHRIMRHADLIGPSEFLPKHPDFRILQNNSGLEALAINVDGKLLTIPERSVREDLPFPVYLYDGSEWTQPTAISKNGAFLVTGADFGPNGRLYVLERALGVPVGFAMRIRRFALVNDRLTNEETLLVNRFNILENMEGISVWVDSSGQTRLTLVSDNNFNRLLPTIISEYLVND